MTFSIEKKFIILGLLNFLITNIVLQILLLVTTINLSTLISQITNISLGYLFYSKYVFLVEKKNYNSFLKYLYLAFFSWQLNSLSINFLHNQFSLNKNNSAFLMIPLLTIISFLAQKYYVFKK